MRRSPKLLAQLLSVAALLASRQALAEVFEVSPPDDVEAAIAMLAPGDELIVHGGTYTLTERFGIDIAGTEAMPIVVRAADGEVPVLDRPNADQNVIDIDSAEYLVLRGLVVSGGSHGIRIISARFLTIEGCEIKDTADVALSANSGGPYENLHIVANHIHDTDGTGEGMYLGCNSDACRIQDSIIERNWVHNTNAPSVEQGDGIEIKEGSFNNIVRDNVIHDTNYPCILTYSTVGNGGPNVIERNAMWGCGDHGIQSAADAIIRNNIILGSNADGIAMQPHQAGAPANLVVVHNTILKQSGSGISLSGAVGSVVIANNAVYAMGEAIGLGGDVSQTVVAGNVGQGSGPSGFSGAGTLADFVGASFSGMPPNDVFPAAGSTLIGAGDAAHVVTDDFNGTARNGVADAGAYVFDASGNPGWTIGPGFKDQTPTGEGGGPSTSSSGQTGATGGTSGSGSGTTSGPGAGSGGSDGAGGADGGDGEDGCDCRATSASSSVSSIAWILAFCAAFARSLRHRRGDAASSILRQHRRR